METKYDGLHEYMHGTLNDSPVTDEETKIRYLGKKDKGINRKASEIWKTGTEETPAPNWSRQRERPVVGKKCALNAKGDHFAKFCRSNKRVNP